MRKSLVTAFVTTASLIFAFTAAAQQQPPAQPTSPAAAIAPADPNAWRIDATHSDLSFSIRHFVSRVRGTFGRWAGTIVVDTNDVTKGSVDVTIQATSIDTQNENRDNDLRSANFFEVEKYPTITFRSTKVEGRKDELTVTGDLTIRGVTKPVVLKGRYLGVTAPDQRGTRRIGFEASTMINRLDYDVTWNRAVEGGGVMLGDEVRIDIVIEAMKAAPRP
jgi:polyisoprenoid-binding protein YceI